MTRIGSLFSGCGGLDLAVETVFGAQPAWFCEQADRPAAILNRHWPGVPVVPDVREIDESYGPVDVLHGGYPCQPFSDAGRRLGVEDERDMWPEFFRCIRILRPRLVILENVSGHLARGFQRTLVDLASIGFSARWRLLRAADVGAPHLRNRLFAVAHSSSGGTGWNGGEISGAQEPRWAQEDECNTPFVHRELVANPNLQPPRRSEPEFSKEGRGAGTQSGKETAADSGIERSHGRRERGCEGGRGWSTGGGQTITDTDFAGPQGAQPEKRSELPARQPRSSTADANGGGQPRVGESWPERESRGELDRCDPAQWGSFAPAIARWQRVTGELAPRPTDDRGRLDPAFVEWMMGLPLGWTEGIARKPRLQMLGNAVVPLQAVAAIRLLT